MSAWVRHPGGMPSVSLLRGIDIRIHYLDHAPPHVHALHCGREALIDIATGGVLRGSLPAAQIRLLQPWVASNRPRLLEAWDLASTSRPPGQIIESRRSCHRERHLPPARTL